MIDTKDARLLDLYLNNADKFLMLLRQLAEEEKLNPNSQKCKDLKKEFVEQYEQTKTAQLELDKKPEVKKFVNELDLRDVEPEREQLLNLNEKYKILNVVERMVKADPSINQIEKVELGKQMAVAFSKVKDF